jgi:predicted DNA-binding transcriptional regulator AlpA
MDSIQANVTSRSYGGRKASTVDEFCAEHSISRAMFYKLQKAGQAPRTMRVGSKQLISEEAAFAWRSAMTETAA